METTPERLENCPPTPELLQAINLNPNPTIKSLEEARILTVKGGESNCVICLNRCVDQSFPDSCLHVFCFECISKWTQQKNSCPLCKKNFDTIIHNVKSKSEYDTWKVPITTENNMSQDAIEARVNSLFFRARNSMREINFASRDQIPTLERTESIGSVFLNRLNYLTSTPSRRRYTFRTTLQASYEQNEAIQEFFEHRRTQDVDYSRFTPQAWRRYIYEHHLYAVPLPDITGRFRESSAQFYRANPAQTHRLIPWLNRELVALMPAWNASVIPEILEQMRDYLLDHDIQAESTKNYFLRYLHANTTHFLHEFHNYAVSPYDMVGYDRIVEYNGRPLNSHGAGFNDAGVITVSSSDSSSSSDSEDIRVVDEERSTEVTIEADNCMVVTSIANGANISNNDALNDIGGSNHATGGSLYRNTNDVSTPIATGNVSVSSDDSDSEVQFVLARKPPHLRTPEQVTLDSASDSDVIYIANSPNEPAVIDSSDTSDNEPLSKTVKRLKSEHSDPMINEQKPLTQPMLDMPTLDLPIETFNIYNFGASTSNSFKNMHPKKMYCKPNRKRSIGKSIYEKSSSETSGSSSNNDGDWYVNSANNSNTKKKVSKKAKKSTKSSKKRKDSERKHKKRRTESSSNVTMDEDFCNNNSKSTTGCEDIKNVDPLMNKVKVYKVYSPLLRQILSALGPILATISAGMTTGFSAVFLPQLQQNTSSIQITMEESSWIASITAFGMAPGCLLGGLIMQKYGRKFAHYFLCIPTVLGWISIMFATNVPLILVGRLLTGKRNHSHKLLHYKMKISNLKNINVKGMAVGLLGPCSSVFIGESSEPKYRGFLLASITFSISLGMLCGHLLGTFLFWKDVAVVCSIFPVTICIALSFVPESPFWLLSQDRIDDAKEAFRWLRGCSPEAMEEIENLVSKHNVTKKEERALEVNAFGILKINLKKPEFVKPLGIILFFFMVMQFSDVYGTFFIYGCVALAGTAVLYFLLPETKNKTLQQIEEEFKVK
ncbi:unnamed protein product [Diamesa hyperborea]